MTTAHPSPTVPARSAPVPVTPADIVGVASTLASAFVDDPVFAWFVPDAGVRRACLPDWFAVVVEAMLDHRISQRTEDGSAAALWAPPDTEPMTADQTDRLVRATAGIGSEELGRLGALIDEMEASHPHEAHHYLWFLGVAPEQQGRGLGSGLLGSYLATLDATGEAAYLEATSPDNRRLYERHGFEVTGVIATAGSPPMWAMWRDPR